MQTQKQSLERLQRNGASSCKMSSHDWQFEWLLSLDLRLTQA